MKKPGIQRTAIQLIALGLCFVPLLSADEPERLGALSDSIEQLYDHVQAAIVAIDGGAPGEIKASGTIVDERGYIVTCARAIRRAGSVDVELYDGTHLSGTIVGRDGVNDLAVIKVEAAGLTSLELRDPPYLPGLVVASVGNSFGSIDADHQPAISLGVVSDYYRVNDGYRGYVLETDCAVNPGSFGGPLVDMEGRVVAICNRAFTLNKWMGSGVPANQIKAVLPRLILGASVRHGLLGLRLKEEDGGLRIREITEGSPNEGGSLEIGDLLLRADGDTLSTLGDLRNFMIGIPAETRFPVTILRDGKKLRADVLVGFRAGDCMAARRETETLPAGGWIGMGIEGGDPRDLTISVVAEESPASRAGLLPGDVIVAVNGVEITDIHGLREKLKDLPIGLNLYFDVLREGFPRRALVTTSRRPEVVASTETHEERPGWLGVAFETGSPKIARVLPDSPAKSAGLLPGDRVVALAEPGGSFLSTPDLKTLRETMQPLAQAGKIIRLKVQREGWERIVLVTLGERPDDWEQKSQADSHQATGPGFLGVLVSEHPSLVALVVQEVTRGGPAERAGLRAGDLVYKAGELEIGTIEDLSDLLANSPPGSLLELSIYRRGRRSVVRVTLGSPEEGSGRPAEPAFLGLAFGDGGLVIDEILPSSPAERAGLLVGDWIVRLAEREVDSIEDVARVLAEHSAGDRIGITVNRHGESIDLECILGSAAGAPKEEAPDRSERRAVLGVRLEGLAVTDVVQGSAAERFGVMAGDVIVAIDGAELEGYGALVEALRARNPGDKISLLVRRGEGEVELEVVLGPLERGDRPQRDRRRGALGLRLDGLKISQILPDGPAMKAGFLKGDLLSSIDGERLSGTEQLRRIFSTKKAGDQVSIEIERTVRLKLGERDGRTVLGIATNPDDLTVRAVLEGSGAAEAGIQAGDRIVAVAGRGVTGSASLREILAEQAPEAVIMVKILRAISVTLPERSPEGNRPRHHPQPANPPRPPEPPRQDARPTLGLRLDENLAVTELQPGGPGEEAGIEVGDILRNLNREVVETREELRRVLGDLRPGQTVKFVVVKSSGELSPGELTLGSAHAPTHPEGRPAFSPASLSVSREAVFFHLPPPLISGFLGVYLQKSDDGVGISGIIDGSAAQRLGLQIGDVIVKVGDEGVARTEDLIECIKGIPYGGELRFTIKRGDRELPFATKLGRRPAENN